MEGLKFVNFDDPLNRWTVDVVAEIATKVKSYCSKRGIKDAELHSVEDNTWSDARNQRFDIEIRYVDARNHLIQQKLLMLNGEVLDGKEFHKRFREFYPEEVSRCS